LGEGLRFMRDATRGGVAAVLNEAVRGTALGLEVEEEAFPVSGEVRAVSDLLGVSPLEIANEGVFVAFVAPQAEAEALRALASHPLGREARVVGRVSRTDPESVILTTRIGGRRVMDFPRGLLLPRIC
jgi:hydrogenase expression/formation protein HypE